MVARECGLAGGYLSMTARGQEAAALALHRFGFGPAGDQIATIAGDPRGALVADLDRPSAGTLTTDLPSSGAAARAVSDFQAERRAQQKLALRIQKAGDADSQPQANTQTMTDLAKATIADAAPAPGTPPLPQQIVQSEA